MKTPKKQVPKRPTKHKRKAARKVMRELFPKEAIDYVDAQLRDAEGTTKVKD